MFWMFFLFLEQMLRCTFRLKPEGKLHSKLYSKEKVKRKNVKRQNFDSESEFLSRDFCVFPLFFLSLCVARNIPAQTCAQTLFSHNLKHFPAVFNLWIFFLYIFTGNTRNVYVEMLWEIKKFQNYLPR